MGSDTVVESLFGNLWKKSHNSQPVESRNASIGILAFEVATLMSKVVDLWERLSDKRITRLRSDIHHSLGVQKLVSRDIDHLMDLVRAEIIDDFGYVAESVARLGKRCADPLYHRLEYIFDHLIEMDLNWFGWEYRLKKMERKVKKMKRFSANTAQLYQEFEVLAELEQNLRRMNSSVGSSKIKSLEFQQKVFWHRHEVNNLCVMSPWIRTYDYTVRLLLRSLFTILERITHVYGANQVRRSNNSQSHTTLVRCHSMSSLLRPSDPPSDDDQSGPLGRSVSNLGPSTVKKSSYNNKMQTRYQSSIFCGRPPQGKTRKLAPVRSFRGCMTGGSDSHLMQSCVPTSNFPKKSSSVFHEDKVKKADTAFVSHGNMHNCKSFQFYSKYKLLAAPVSTLGGAALALHYANTILLIEKLASSPYPIGHDDRDHLYNMLPASLRNSLSAKLRLFSKTSASLDFDPTLAAKWNIGMRKILEWLAPLAHNMLKWRSERNFENQRIVSRTTVLLVQTLHFANQEMTEAAIIELLMGLSYISRFSIEFYGKAFSKNSCTIDSENYLNHLDNFSVIDHTSELSQTSHVQV